MPSGCRNVSKLITAFREDDQVIIVMPYEMSDDFRVGHPLSHKQSYLIHSISTDTWIPGVCNII
jgi:hypothetical protein